MELRVLTRVYFRNSNRANYFGEDEPETVVKQGLAEIKCLKYCVENTLENVRFDRRRLAAKFLCADGTLVALISGSGEQSSEPRSATHMPDHVKGRRFSLYY